MVFTRRLISEYKFDVRRGRRCFSIGSRIDCVCVARQCAVHPRLQHNIMDVGRRAARLTEFALVLEVPLISWPMSRLHARNPPFSSDHPQPPTHTTPFNHPRLFPLSRSRRLRRLFSSSPLRVRHACGALRIVNDPSFFHSHH